MYDGSVSSIWHGVYDSNLGGFVSVGGVACLVSNYSSSAPVTTPEEIAGFSFGITRFWLEI